MYIRELRVNYRSKKDDDINVVLLCCLSYIEWSTRTKED